MLSVFSHACGNALFTNRFNCCYMKQAFKICLKLSALCFASDINRKIKIVCLVPFNLKLQQELIDGLLVKPSFVSSTNLLSFFYLYWKIHVFANVQFSEKMVLRKVFIKRKCYILNCIEKQFVVSYITFI